MPAHHTLLSPSTAPDYRPQVNETTVSVEDLHQQLVGTNINEQTFLATDYLNHFNEIVMLIEMLPSMPDCMEDICHWQPKSYEMHFSESGFRDKNLAILAFQNAPEMVRKRFDEIITILNRDIIDAIESLKETYEMGAPEHLSALCEQLNVELSHHIDRASAIINGHNVITDPDDFTMKPPPTRDSIEKTQATVEALFGD